MTSTLIAGAVCAPVLGRLGDMYGKRRMLIVAPSVMSLGCVLGTLSDEFVLVLLARILQGAAMGVVPLGISIMRDELPEERLGFGIALMSSTLGAGEAVGLPLTGVVAEHMSWHWLFAGAAVLGTVLIVLIVIVVPESPLCSGGRFDSVGALGLSAGLIALLLAITQGNLWGWTSPIELGLAAAAVLTLGLWAFHEMRLSARVARSAAHPRQPLVDLRVSARTPVLLTNIASVLIGYAMFTSFMVSAQIFQAPR
ncbi:MFS transporter [Rhodococcus koreensis]